MAKEKEQCEGGVMCPVHDTFAAAVLDAVNAGTKRVETLVNGMWRDINRRLDEALAERVRLQTRLEQAEQRLSAVTANVDAILREGHPLRRSEDAGEPAAVVVPEDHVPALPRWVAVALASSFALSGVAILLILVIIKDPAVRSALLKALSGGVITQ